MHPLSLTYSLADQNFAATKSLGILNLSLQLVHELARRPEFTRLTVLSNSTLDDRLALPPHVQVRRHDQAVRSRLHRVLWDQINLYGAARRTGNEWLFLPKGFASFLSSSPARLATYVHDCVHEHYRQHHPGALPRFETTYFTRCLVATLRRSSVIFTNSDFTRSEVIRFARHLSMPTPSIVAAGIGFTAPPAASVTKEDRLMVLASPLPHKRTDVAVSHLHRWQRLTAYPGTIDWVGNLPRGLSLPPLPNWRWRPRMQENEYRGLLQAARVLVFFSDYEGFGMPPVEAALVGTCPVYSDIPSIREVMLGTGFGFALASFDSFAGALGQALQVSPPQMLAWGACLHERHNWEAVVTRIVGHLSGVVSPTQGT